MLLLSNELTTIQEAFKPKQAQTCLLSTTQNFRMHAPNDIIFAANPISNRQLQLPLLPLHPVQYSKT
jgi:hypothetical protein